MEPTATNPLELSPIEIDSKIEKLSPRQMEVISHIARGLSCKQIAPMLDITVVTVKKHTQRAMLRLGLENRTQLIVLFAVWAYAKKQEAIEINIEHCVIKSPIFE